MSSKHDVSTSASSPCPLRVSAMSLRSISLPYTNFKTHVRFALIFFYAHMFSSAHTDACRSAVYSPEIRTTKYQEYTMSDTHRRYYAIRRALLQLLPTEPTGHAARHFMTLVSLICGMIGSHSVQLPKIACCMPLGPQQRESHIKRIQRWLQNDRIDTGIHYLPYAQYIVQKCAQDQIIIAIDGSVVARGCVALMASMIYHNRALPLTWLVKSGKKGHFSEEMHCSILDQLKPIIPPQRSITIVGDGEFDNIEFLKKITAYGWTYEI